MNQKFNINRPKLSDDEIRQGQNFQQLVERFKQQSLKKARGDESWWKNKKIKYSTVIAGVTVICTITYFSLFKNESVKSTVNDKITTQHTSTSQNKPSKRNTFIEAPLKKLQTPYSVYSVNTKKGATIQHNGKSKIKIEKNSFVDKHGRDIVGDVTIEYKEFHDAGDIILNGIPMAYDSAGKSYNLESAGMFDIRGYQNGEAVFIKKEKPIEIELASENTEARFNQYYLDTITHNWQYLQKDKLLIAHPTNESVASKNQKTNSQLKSEEKLSQLKHEIEVVLPRKKDSVQTLYATKIQKLPATTPPLQPKKYSDNKPSFKLDGSYEDFPELASFKDVLFEVAPENKNYSKELHNITWSDVKISEGPQKGKNYILTLSYRNRSERLIVYPVFRGEEFERVEKIYESKLADYQKALQKRNADENKLMDELKLKQAAYLAEQKKKQEQYNKEKAEMLAKYNLDEQLALQSNFQSLSSNNKSLRLFRIAQFGIYNSDCPHTLPTDQTITPIFVSNERNNFINPDFVYLIDHNKNTVFSYSRNNGFVFQCDSNSNYSICVFAKNKTFVCRKSDFKQSQLNKSNKFSVTELKDKVTNDITEFKKYLEI